MPSIDALKKSFALILLILLAPAACYNSGKQENTTEPAAVDLTQTSATTEMRSLPVKSENPEGERKPGHFNQSPLLDTSGLPVLDLRPFGIEYEIKPTGGNEPLIRVDAFIETELVIENIPLSPWSMELTLTAPTGRTWQDKYQFNTGTNTIYNTRGQLAGFKNDTVPGDLYSIHLSFNVSLPEGVWLFRAVFSKPELKPLTTSYHHKIKRVCVQDQAEINPLGKSPTDTFTSGSKIYIYGADAPPGEALLLAFYRYAEEGEVAATTLLNPQVAECATQIPVDQDGRYQTVFTVGPHITKGSYILAKGTAPDNLELAYFSGQFEIE